MTFLTQAVGHVDVRPAALRRSGRARRAGAAGRTRGSWRCAWSSTSSPYWALSSSTPLVRTTVGAPRQAARAGEAEIEHDADRLAPSPSARWRVGAGLDLGGDGLATSALAAALKVARGGARGRGATGGGVGAMPLRKSSPIRDARGAGRAGAGRAAGRAGAGARRRLTGGAGAAAGAGRGGTGVIVGGGGAGAIIGAGVGSIGSASPISGAWLGGGGVAIGCGAAAVSATSSTSSTSIAGGSGGVVDAREADRQRGDQRDVEQQRGAGPGHSARSIAHGASPPTETRATRLRPARLSSPITRITRP